MGPEYQEAGLTGGGLEAGYCNVYLQVATD